VEHKLCVLIDFENLAAGTEKEGLGRFDVRAVFRRLKDKGRILVSRSYGDWGRFARFKQKLLEEGVTMVELTSYRGAEKNRADIALVVDAMEIAYTRPHVDTFVLLSGDSDFTPLVMRLKELDKRVIGIGTRGSTSRLLVECCDEFMFYESLRKAAQLEAAEEEDEGDELPARARPASSMSREVAFALLVETMAGVQKDEPGPVQGGLIKQGILRKAPAFDENELGYPTFARFLEQAQERGLVRLIRDGKGGGYRVDQPGSTMMDAPPPAAAPIEVAEDDDNNGPLMDLRGEAARLQALLIEAGVVPVGHMARHTVVHEFVDHVVERQQRKKRNTLTYVYGDIARRCRKTDPMVPARVVRAVINALKMAGELVHTSGEPVRSATANFVLQRDADDLLKSIRQLYVSTLLEKGERLADGQALSMLLWNDDQHEVDAGELVAFTQRKIELGQLRPPVVFDPADEAAAEAQEEPAPPAEEQSEGRGRRRRSDRRGGRSEAPAAEAQPSEPTPAATAPEAAPQVDENAPQQAALEEASPSEEAPSSGRRRRSSGRSGSKTPAEGAADEAKATSGRSRSKAAPKEGAETSGRRRRGGGSKS
jgi:uncharacterized LabA/DUF88 family protein